MGKNSTSPAKLADKLNRSHRKALSDRELKISDNAKEVVSALNSFRSAMYGYCSMWDDLGAGEIEHYKVQLNELRECADEAMGIATRITGEWLMCGLLASDFEEF